MSASATPRVPTPVVKSTFAANELLEKFPTIEVLRKTENDEVPELATTSSGFPSPSMSPTATSYGFDAVGKSTLVPKEAAVNPPWAAEL